ncbi:hypothetical protein ACIPC1_39305 [Streptomyces sp. NPDC087263]|uniref:hypothetical protein n=1 Tax=Streptomyces sp. NPDC087263 TaxID=3365773 RepID=UPI0037FA0556
MNDDAYRLARARAVRAVSLAAAAGELRELQQAAADVERRLVEVAMPGGGRGVMMRWLPDVEPVSGVVADPKTHREATPSQLLTLGAALRLCWPDPDRAGPYPGRAVAEEDVLAACAPPGDGPLLEGIASIGQTSPYRRALRTLRACGYLAADVGDGLVRLGPMVAAWSERDIDELRRGYNCLPCAEKE